MHETITSPPRSQRADTSDCLTIRANSRRATHAFAAGATGGLDQRRAIALDRHWIGYAEELRTHCTLESTPVPHDVTSRGIRRRRQRLTPTVLGAAAGEVTR